MKIAALRVADIGRFSEPVALEGFADGLTVFTGDNELGKSTLFRALLSVFKYPYTSKDKAIAALQPYGGGAPMIEVDFTAQGKSWRVRKRFLGRALAELTDLGTGTIIARNADVQAHLDALHAGPGGLERFGLLWVAQGDTLAPLKFEADTSTTLRQLIQQEIEGASADEQARRVHARVGERLDALLSHKRTRPAGPYAAALAERTATEQRRHEMTERLAAAEDRLAKLSAAVEETDRLRNPVARAARQSAIADAEQALRAFIEDRNRARTALEQLRTAESEAAAARLAHKSWHDDLARLAAVDTDLEGLAAEVATSGQTRADAERNNAAARADLQKIAEKISSLEQSISAARIATEHAERVRQRDELHARLETLHALQAEARAATAAIAANPVDDAALKRLNALAAGRARLDQRLADAAPEVEIEPLPGAAGQIALDGERLTGSAARSVRQPLVIDIDGIGRITVRPGGSDAFTTAETERARHDRDLTTLLAALAVPDIATADRQAESRRHDERRRDEAFARLSALAPGGIDPIVAAHARLVATTAIPLAPPTERPLAEHLADMANLASDRREIEKRVADAARGLEHARRKELEAATLLAATRRHHVELGTRLGAEPDRTARTVTLDRALADAEVRLASAARDATAWRDVDRSDARHAELTRRLADAKAADAADLGRLHQLDLDIRAWETALDYDSDADIEHAAEAATHAARIARERADDLEMEIAALKQLDSLLSAAFATERANIAEPVARRIGPYLDMVLPGASLGLDDGLSPSGVVRNGRTEQLDRISRGTAEQIAVVARLGLARLLADRGAPAPLVLDDALVYADDRRIRALFSALTEAAHHHQVIILTCRERTFDALAGRRLQLLPWRAAT